MSRRKTYKTVVRTKVPKLNIENVPDNSFNGLARATLRAIERYFELPGVKEDYEKWLAEYRKTHPEASAKT